VDRVADFQVGQPTDTRLLMAYGHLSEAEILEGIGRLGAAIR
jgi:DNA-binding transcriptional MocR family regulator